MSKLRLGPLPKTETIKLTIAVPVALKSDLDHYASIHTEANGEKVDAVALIPHMIECFIERDRGFQKVRKQSRAAKSQT